MRRAHRALHVPDNAQTWWLNAGNHRVCEWHWRSPATGVTQVDSKTKQSFMTAKKLTTYGATRNMWTTNQLGSLHLRLTRLGTCFLRWETMDRPGCHRIHEQPQQLHRTSVCRLHFDLWIVNKESNREKHECTRTTSCFIGYRHKTFLVAAETLIICNSRGDTDKCRTGLRDKRLLGRQRRKAIT